MIRGKLLEKIGKEEQLKLIAGKHLAVCEKNSVCEKEIHVLKESSLCERNIPLKKILLVKKNAPFEKESP